MQKGYKQLKALSEVEVEGARSIGGICPGLQAETKNGYGILNHEEIRPSPASRNDEP